MFRHRGAGRAKTASSNLPIKMCPRRVRRKEGGQDSLPLNQGP